MRITYILLLFSLLGGCNPQKQEDASLQSTADWMLVPFVKQDAVNPVLTPNAGTTFNCPIRQKTVHWEVKDVFNPAAVVKEGKVHLLYRAEDSVGMYSGTSRIGLAISADGLHFERLPDPVLFPDNDFMQPIEWEGGCEDPRVVEDDNGTYYMTYTAYDGEVARLCVASSPDLMQWEKHGLAFADAYEGKYAKTWSKSGAIVCQQEGHRLIATKINGKYWMYWGDTDLFLASSDNLTDWVPLEDENGALQSVLSVRENHFDSDLVEPGPPALLTQQGILLLYNARNSDDVTADTTLDQYTYAAGQVLFAAKDPARIVQRSSSYFIKPEKDYEISGQVNQVCFVEGLVFFNNQWLLYYGTADSKIAMAVCNRPAF